MLPITLSTQTLSRPSPLGTTLPYMSWAVSSVQAGIGSVSVLCVSGAQ